MIQAIRIVGVRSHQALTQNDDGSPGIGEHSSDPFPGDEDNETPREGVGNQQEGHPSDHADTISAEDFADDVPECADRLTHFFYFLTKL